MDALVKSATYSLLTKVVSMLNIKKATPPNTNGLNFRNSPETVVANPAINNMTGGGMIPILMQIKVPTKNVAAVTCHSLLK